jgi:hypothetical protein
MNVWRRQMLVEFHIRHIAPKWHRYLLSVRIPERETSVKHSHRWGRSHFVHLRHFRWNIRIDLDIGLYDWAKLLICASRTSVNMISNENNCKVRKKKKLYRKSQTFDPSISHSWIQVPGNSDFALSNTWNIDLPMLEKDQSIANRLLKWKMERACKGMFSPVSFRRTETVPSLETTAFDGQTAIAEVALSGILVICKAGHLKKH